MFDAKFLLIYCKVSRQIFIQMFKIQLEHLIANPMPFWASPGGSCISREMFEFCYGKKSLHRYTQSSFTNPVKYVVSS